jgi:large subunit ribosomal protein L23
MFDIIKRPLVTEKNTVYSSMNTFVFEVDKRARKEQIKTAIEKAFKVKVEEVRTQVCRNRARRTGATLSAVRYWKKAYVKLAPGEKIGLFEGA